MARGHSERSAKQATGRARRRRGPEAGRSQRGGGDAIRRGKGSHLRGGKGSHKAAGEGTQDNDMGGSHPQGDGGESPPEEFHLSLRGGIFRGLSGGAGFGNEHSALFFHQRLFR